MLRAVAVTLSLGLATLGAVPAGAAATGEPGWTTQRVAKAGRADDFALTRTFIDIAPSGQSVILYSNGPNDEGGFDLRLACGPRPDGSFRRESIDPDDELITGYPSLALGPQGRPHVSYVSGVFQADGVLKYAVRRHHEWTNELADSVTPVGQTAIAVGPPHRPVIAYTRVNTELRLATRGPDGWVTSPVSGERVVALDVAVDASGSPEIAYVAWDGSSYVARLAKLDGSSWSFETVGHVSSQGIEFGIDLLIGADGREDLVFPVLEPVQGLAYARSTPSGWKVELVAAGDLWQPTLAYDITGGLHVVFYDATPGALTYGKRSGGHWLLETVADSDSPSVRIGRLSSIVMDSDGRARVSYYVGKETGGTTVRYAVSVPQ